MPRAERPIRELGTKWLNGGSQAVKRVAEMLHKSGFSIEDVAAQNDGKGR